MNNTLLRIRKVLLALIVLSNYTLLNASPLPIQFSIPEIKMVTGIPEKDRDFASLIPGKLDTYIYTQENEYYRGYQRSYFALTCKKGGWDCMRHYEILANGCIPYFLDLDKCHPEIMKFLPRHLIKEAMNLEGVSYPHIDHSRFDKKRYYEILNELITHTRKYLTTKNMASYVLKTINYSGLGKILYLSQDVSPDYMRECVLIGLKELIGDRVTDFPKIDFLYTSYAKDISELYGRGFSYTKIIDDVAIDRNNIEQRIRNKEFEIIIYGSVHRGLPFHDLVKKTYNPQNIVYICGEDSHKCPYTHFQTLFLREFE